MAITTYHLTVPVVLFDYITGSRTLLLLMPLSSDSAIKRLDLKCLSLLTEFSPTPASRPPLTLFAPVTLTVASFSPRFERPSQGKGIACTILFSCSSCCCCLRRRTCVCSWTAFPRNRRQVCVCVSGAAGGSGVSLKKKLSCGTKKKRKYIFFLSFRRLGKSESE